jgi:hypothetical protein
MKIQIFAFWVVSLCVVMWEDWNDSEAHGDSVFILRTEASWALSVVK